MCAGAAVTRCIVRCPYCVSFHLAPRSSIASRVLSICSTATYKLGIRKATQLFETSIRLAAKCLKGLPVWRGVGRNCIPLKWGTDSGEVGQRRRGRRLTNKAKIRANALRYLPLADDYD